MDRRPDSLENVEVFLTTLPKLLAMGQITQPLEDRWILTYTPAAKYDSYLGYCYDTQQAMVLREKGFLLVRGWVRVSGPVPPEWQMMQPGGGALATNPTNRAPIKSIA